MTTFISKPLADLNTNKYVAQFTHFDHHKYAKHISELSFIDNFKNDPVVVNAIEAIAEIDKNLLSKENIKEMLNVVYPHYEGPNVFTTFVDPSTLFIYTPLQRPTNDPALIKALMNYDPNAVGQLTVIEDSETGFRYIINGQHTAIRAYLLGNPVSVKIIKVDRKKTNILQEMSSLFINLNTATPVSLTTKGISNIVMNPKSNHSAGFSIVSALGINTASISMAKPGGWHHPRKMSISLILKHLDSQSLYDSLAFYQHIANDFYSKNDIRKFDSFVAGSIAILIFLLREKGYGVDFDALERAILNGKKPIDCTFESVCSTLLNRIRNSNSVFDAYQQKNSSGEWFLDHNDLSDFTGNCFTWKAIGLFDLYINEIPADCRPVNKNNNVINYTDVFDMTKTRRKKGMAKDAKSPYKENQPRNISL